MTRSIAPQCYTVHLGIVDIKEPCECCGEITKGVTGTVARHDDTFAAYYVSWTQGRYDSARWEFVVGCWGENASADERVVVRANYRNIDEPALMIVDADDALYYPRLATRWTKRVDVIGTPLAEDIFAIYDTIVLHDERLSELHPWLHFTRN